VSEVHKFIFNGLPVRGIVVRLTDTWVEILRRRASNTSVGAYPVPVRDMLGELVADCDGNWHSGRYRYVEPNGQCFRSRALRDHPGSEDQVSWSAALPLIDSKGQQIEQINELLEHYMLQSEQLDTTLVLAANEEVAAGLLIQRLPMQGSANLSGSAVGQDGDDQIGLNEDYNRIAVLASSLKRNELLTLDVDTILHRLFWEERITRFEPLRGDSGPRFSCSCSRERVGRMILSLGLEETKGILHERGNIEVACEFCGLQYHFDAIDALQLFASPKGGVSAGSGPH
jgi:molecular chaperone Hsp33